MKGLTYKLLELFNNRKRTGLFSVIVNTRIEKVHPVPRYIEHIAFTCKLLKIDKKRLLENPDIASHLVPSNININDKGFIDGIITGISGLELGAKVKHTKYQLDTAHNLVLLFIQNGEVPVAEKLQTNKIMTTYIKR
ncbi:MAG TPA: hypothetical protein VJG30_05100 [Candidatus Nanoarchaeia archaeon]|nr:hypothetical protein [Candidatus Nanoarchaeia archaeon]